MDYAVSILTALASATIAVTALWAVMDPKVDDGVLIKFGLIGVMLGSGSIAFRMFGLVDGIAGRWDVVGIQRGLLLINFGILAIMAGYAVRRSDARHPLRRRSDWARRVES